MKPLTEWTDADLRYATFHGKNPFLEDDDFDRQEALAELLRRERERCADVCRDWAADMRTTWDIQTNKWAHQEAAGAEECEHRIREMQ
jgi:hypothetical protein